MRCSARSRAGSASARSTTRRSTPTCLDAGRRATARSRARTAFGPALPVGGKVSYFTAVLARDGEKWFAHDVDVEDLEDVGELTVALRGVAMDEEPVLLLVEREDAWWAVVRVDADDDPRSFVSALLGASASPYAKALGLEESDEDDDVEPGTPSGDFDVLADLGSSAEDLAQICEDELVPMDALAALAEAGGFDEVLDSLR